jgi:predicted DNA-binding transcriptional regulator AlpA
MVSPPRLGGQTRSSISTQDKRRSRTFLVLVLCRRQPTEDRAIPTKTIPNKPWLRVQLLSRKEVLSLVPISYPTMWQMMRDGRFPRSRMVGKNKVGWLASEVADWIVNRPKVLLKGDFDLSKQPSKKKKPRRKGRG